jgi:hypothetical protein
MFENGFWFYQNDCRGFLVLQADTKFYQNQTKVHPPDFCLKFLAFVLPSSLIWVFGGVFFSF